MEGKNTTKLEHMLLQIYGVGIIGHIFLLELMLALTPVALLITATIVLWNQSKKWLVWTAVVGTITFFLEVLGVHTGLVFGEYIYGTVLGPTLFGAPLIIALNWATVVQGGLYFARLHTQNRYVAALGASILAVIFDILLEPVAIALGYWQWDAGLPGIHNFAGWFFIALAGGLIAPASAIPRKAAVNLLLQATLFIVTLLLLSL